MPKKKSKKVRINVRVSYPRAGEFLVGVTLDESDIQYVARYNNNPREIVDEIVQDIVGSKIKVALASRDDLAVVKRAVEAYLGDPT